MPFALRPSRLRRPAHAPRSSAVVVVLTAAAVSVPLAAMAGAGDLDPTFSEDGRLFIQVGDPERDVRANATDVSVTPTGDILAVGGPYVSSFPGRAFVAKLTEFGAPSPDFGTNGVQVFGPHLRTGDTVRATHVVGQPDGKAVVAGTYEDCEGEACTYEGRLWRFDVDASADQSFGNGHGVLRLRGRAAPAEVLVGPDDGSLTVCGSGYLQRRLADGRLDRSFGTRGTTDVPGGDPALTCRQTADGGVLVVSAGGRIRLFKVTADGSPDESFGAGGERSTAPPTGMGFIGTATIRPDGSVLLGGSSLGERLAVVSVTAKGRLDRSFSDDGLATVALTGDAASAGYVGADAEGRVVAVGSELENTVIVRLEADGVLDPSFADDGVFRDTFLNGFAIDGEVDPSGAVLALIDVDVVQPEGNVGFVRLLGD